MSTRRTLNAFLHRRKSLIVKLILILPITWIIITTLLSFSDRINSESGAIMDEPSPILDTGDKYEGRKPRQSAEEHFDVLPKAAAKREKKKHHQIHHDSNQELAVLAIPGDRKHDGPGEQGKPVVLTNLTDEQDALVKEGWENNAFNQYVSDMISLHRGLPDVRSRGCVEEEFSKDLPPTSVIVCFHNEAWSVLMRTVHSILDRSPPNLIEEIILVDDFSDLPHLGKQLDDYLVHIPKVKVVRAKKREGLIRARLLGASVSKAPILTYLDSHCECAHGWLEPLLQRIANNWTTVVCPVIDVIDDDTFEYHFRESGEVNVGGFDWNLQFNWHAMPDREVQRRRHNWEPVWSPTMAGGLFSINKKFFERLGTYDSGFDIWGGENLELSFKTWMCGGSLEILPCSHVGHIFRKRSPYSWRAGVNVLRKNSVRLAEVWLDEYKQYFYDRIGNDLGDFGDVTSRKELRKKLNCKSFDWYMKNVYPELFVPGNALGQGEIRNLGDGGDTCLDSAAKPADFHKPIGLWPCHAQGGNQYFMFSKEGEIKRDEACLDFSGGEVILYPCHGSGGNQMWIYDPNLHTITHGSSRKCMGISKDKQSVTMSECDGSERQKWLVENYDPSKMARSEASSES